MILCFSYRVVSWFSLGWRLLYPVSSFSLHTPLAGCGPCLHAINYSGTGTSVTLGQLSVLSDVSYVSASYPISRDKSGGDIVINIGGIATIIDDTMVYHSVLRRPYIIYAHTFPR